MRPFRRLRNYLAKHNVSAIMADRSESAYLMLENQSCPKPVAAKVFAAQVQLLKDESEVPQGRWRAPFSKYETVLLFGSK